MGLLMFEKSLTIVRWFLLVPKIDVHELMSFGRLIEGEANVPGRRVASTTHPKVGFMIAPCGPEHGIAPNPWDCPSSFQVSHRRPSQIVKQQALPF